MNCLFWKIQGLGKGEKIMTIRNLVENNKVTFMGLVEIKHKRTIRSRMKRMCGSDDCDVCEVYASDSYGGGVVAVWDPRSFSVSNKYSGDRWILLEGCINIVNFDVVWG